jgi:signal transduction histidine kinase
VDLETAADTETLAKATQYIDRILLQLRTISNNLMPQALLRKGLLVAVEEFVGERPARGKMNIEFRFQDEIKVEPEQGIHLYRIIMEIIHNAEKHAEASEMKILFTAEAGLLRLELKDNGRGFDTKDKETTQRGLGLKNILSRVETLKGNMYLDSGPKKGTEYTIEIPRVTTT